jgi:L-malate glycosyltransferase
MRILPRPRALSGPWRRRTPDSGGTTRVRLLKVVATLMCGGTENQFMSLGRSLDRRRFELEFACLRRLGGFVHELDERRIPLREYNIATFRSVKSLAHQAQFARHVTERRIDIVHAYSFYGNVFAILPARMAGAPVVIASVRDLAPYLTPAQKRVQRLVCRFADCVLVNAEAVRNQLISERYDPSKIVVIRNGVDVSPFGRAAASKRLRSELGLAPASPVVGVVSRLTRLKGLEQFLEAAATVARRFPAARFLIVGDTGPDNRAYRTELTSLARQFGVSDRVVFTGLRRDARELLAGFTVSVMPSLSEGLSNVLLESMAAGIPVVATRVGGTPEAIEDDLNGLLVPPADSNALANAICQVLAHPFLAARLGYAARHSAAARFSTEQMVRATEQLYDSLLERRGHVMTPVRSRDIGR